LRATVVVKLHPIFAPHVDSSVGTDTGSDSSVGTDTGSDSSVGTGMGSDSSADTDKVVAPDTWTESYSYSDK
jgi:hypothetical protein